HRVEEVARLERRLGPTLQRGVDGGGVDAGEWLVAGSLYYLAEDVLPLPTGPRRQGRPIRGLAIAGNQPRQRGGGRRVLRRASSAGDGGLILVVEIRRSEFRTKPNTWSLADTHIPNGFSMPGDFPVQVRWARAWHVDNHRTISADCSRLGASVPVDDKRRIMIRACSPTRTSTSAAPACLAARSARAMSAWVTVAGRRAMITALSVAAPQAQPRTAAAPLDCGHGAPLDGGHLRARADGQMKQAGAGGTGHQGGFLHFLQFPQWGLGGGPRGSHYRRPYLLHCPRKPRTPPLLPPGL